METICVRGLLDFDQVGNPSTTIPNAAFKVGSKLSIASGENAVFDTWVDHVDLRASVLHYTIMDRGFIVLGAGFDGLVMTTDGRVITETAHFSPASADVQAVLRAGLPLHDRVLDNVLSAFDGSTRHNYFHTILMSLTRHIVFDKELDPSFSFVSPIETTSFVTIYNDLVDRLQLRPSLRLADGIYPAKNIVICRPEPNTPVFFALRTELLDIRPRLGTRLGTDGGTPTTAIFISREAAADQRLSPAESELLRRFGPELGIRTVVLERMTFREQFEAFYGARKIIGAHGAGLANMIFAEPGADILEINGYVGPDTYIRPWFYFLAMLSGHRYAAIDRRKRELDEYVLREFMQP